MGRKTETENIDYLLGRREKWEGEEEEIGTTQVGRTKK